MDNEKYRIEKDTLEKLKFLQVPCGDLKLNEVDKILKSGKECLLK